MWYITSNKMLNPHIQTKSCQVPFNELYQSFPQYDLNFISNEHDACRILNEGIRFTFDITLHRKWHILSKWPTTLAASSLRFFLFVFSSWGWIWLDLHIDQTKATTSLGRLQIKSNRAAQILDMDQINSNRTMIWSITASAFLAPKFPWFCFRFSEDFRNS